MDSTSTLYFKTLRFDKSNCTHCGKECPESRSEPRLDQNQAQNEDTDSEQLLNELENVEQDLRKCYAILFEYALRQHGITIDFNEYSNSDKNSSSPTISNALCSVCQSTLRQLYKYYKRFVLSAGNGSLVRLIMRDSVIWRRGTAVVRNTKDINAPEDQVLDPNSTRQWTDDNYYADDNDNTGNGNYDNNDEDSNDYDYLPPVTPIVQYDDDLSDDCTETENYNHMIRQPMKSEFKGHPYSVNRQQRDGKVVPISTKRKKLKYRSKAKDDGRVYYADRKLFRNPQESDLQEQENLDNTSTLLGRENKIFTSTKRILRSSTQSQPRQSFAEYSGSTSEDDEGVDIRKRTLKHTRLIPSNRNRNHVNSTRRPSLKLQPVKFSKTMNRDQYLEMRRRSYYNSKIRARLRFASMRIGGTAKFFKVSSSNSNPAFTPSYCRLPQQSHERTCQICHEKFSFAFVLRSHMKSVHGDPSPKYQCSFCPETFAMKKSRKNHELEHHGAELLKASLPCRQEGCLKLFRNVKSRNKHFVSVHAPPEENLICDSCGKSFKTRGGLRQHLRFHEFANNPPDSYKCTECDKAYKSPYALRVHVKTQHTTMKPYLCSLCGVSFSHSYVWKRHLRTIHADGEANPSTTSTTGDADLPYKCQVCGKGWRRKDHLTQHLRGKSHGHPWTPDRVTKPKRVRSKSKRPDAVNPVGIHLLTYHTPQNQNSNNSVADYSMNTSASSHNIDLLISSSSGGIGLQDTGSGVISSSLNSGSSGSVASQIQLRHHYNNFNPAHAHHGNLGLGHGGNVNVINLHPHHFLIPQLSSSHNNDNSGQSSPSSLSQHLQQSTTTTVFKPELPESIIVPTSFNNSQKNYLHF